MPTIAEMLAAKRAAAAQQPVQPVQPVVQTGVASGVAGTQVGTSHSPAQQPKSAAEMLAAFKAAQAAKAAPVAQAAPVVQPPVAKPREYPIPMGTPEVEESHADLCEATRKLAQELEEEQDGIRYWLDRVHEQLRQQPELVHMLTDDQASALYAGIIARSQMTIVPEKAKAASKAKGAAKATKIQLTDEDM